MSTEMSLAKLSQRLVPPILNSQVATRFAALHPLAPAPAPFWMRRRFCLRTHGPLTWVTSKRPAAKFQQAHRPRQAGPDLRPDLDPLLAPADTALIYLHGGAYVQAMSAFQWNIVAGLSDRTSLPVLVVDYPLAPARCAPDAFALTNAVIDYAQLLYKRVILVGDSAGGGLCASLAMQRRDLSLSQVDGLILYSPWVDVTMTNPDIGAILPRDPMLGVPGLKWAGQVWAGKLATKDPRISPLYGSFERLPPMRVFAGSDDIITPDVVEFARRALDAGVDVKLRFEPGAFHVYVAGGPLIPEARRALDYSAQFINQVRGL